MAPNTYQIGGSPAGGRAPGRCDEDPVIIGFCMKN